jgi:hypothetical protein
MPPEGYTTVTINDEVAAKLSRVMTRHDLEPISLAIDHAAQLALLGALRRGARYISVDML